MIKALIKIIKDFATQGVIVPWLLHVFIGGQSFAQTEVFFLCSVGTSLSNDQ
jgi:hypothetical protein